MKYGLLRSALITSALGMFSVTLSESIINTFGYDIFASCIDGTALPTDNFCQYGPQVLINALGAIIFFAATIVVFNKNLRKLTTGPVARSAILAVLFLILISIIWRLQTGLQDNFQLSRGPQTILDYLYVGFIATNTDTLIAGGLIGFAWWLPGKINENAVDASKRKEPKISFKAKKK